MIIPETMRAIRASRAGGPDVLDVTQVDVPMLGPGDVLIKVSAAGVNRPDLRQRQGLYPPPPGVTDILGLEVAGVIVDIGSKVHGFAVGDEVCALLAGGGYAEFCTAPVEQVLPRPQGLSMVEAAAVPETYFTVWTNLFDIGHLASGESVLIHGGASGIGTTAIQLAVAFGARVLCTAGTEKKCESCLKLGADVAINYRKEDFHERVLEETRGRGVDVILDMVCAEYAERNLACLAKGGRLVVIAFLGGGRASIDIEKLVRSRQTLTGSTLRPQTPREKGAIAISLKERVWPLLEQGTIRPIVQSVYPLAGAANAHAELEAGGHFGKVVLSMS